MCCVYLHVCALCPNLEISGKQVNEGASGGVMANAPPIQVGPAHVSYSQFTEWSKCGKAYELKKILGLSESPSWWSIGGHGVHSATEKYDRETLGDNSNAAF